MSALGPGPIPAVLGAILARRVRQVAGSVEILGLERARGRLDAAREEFPGRKLVLFYWIEDVLPMMVTDAGARGLLAPGAEEFRFVCDDSFGGRVAEALLSRLGRRTLLLRRRRPGERIRDLQRILRSREPMGIAVDGHGPYGRVGDAFPRLVESADACAVPLAAVADRAARVRLRALLAVPARRSRIAVEVGAPVVATSAAGAVPFQAALEATRAACRRSLAPAASQAAHEGAW